MNLGLHESKALALRLNIACAVLPCIMLAAFGSLDSAAVGTPAEAAVATSGQPVPAPTTNGTGPSPQPPGSALATAPSATDGAAAPAASAVDAVEADEAPRQSAARTLAEEDALLARAQAISVRL